MLGNQLPPTPRFDRGRPPRSLSAVTVTLFYVCPMCIGNGMAFLWHLFSLFLRWFLFRFALDLVISVTDRSCVSTIQRPPTQVRIHIRQANLSVRFTDKNGDHAEAGKIWENQIFTIKIGLHRPKCTRMCESICQGIRNI